MRATYWYLRTTNVNEDGLEGALPRPEKASASLTLALAKCKGPWVKSQAVWLTKGYDESLDVATTRHVSHLMGGAEAVK
ncbi:hypothetical protein HAX54_033276 [Datura stramonium]|uniref:Uncharacterized protein n=1 Tax=Datura stramonium TaxID=4076 RepID=A0ABS8VEV0_DATST|nr:hypothetical protein [Datura stramonium]